MISLNNYVKRRNGVPLGHPDSLRNMLIRSLSANSFDLFWVYWNPIWNYYLNKYIYKPVESISNRYVSIIFTFSFSGFIHDLVAFFIYKKLAFFFLFWFCTMGVTVVISKHLSIRYSKYSNITVGVINLLTLLVTFYFCKILFLALN